MCTKIAILASIAVSSATAWVLPSRLNLFARAVLPSEKMKPTIVETYKSWSNATCYADLYGNDRQLPNTTDPPLNSANMTVETCLTHYESLGFVFAGLEYGHDCYCGNARPHWYWIGDRKACDHFCGGNMIQSCGGVQHMLVYERPSELRQT